MKCSECRYWVKSKVYGNGCSCMFSERPCEKDRRDKQRKQRNKKKMEMYGKGAKKMRF